MTPSRTVVIGSALPLLLLIGLIGLPSHRSAPDPRQPEPVSTPGSPTPGVYPAWVSTSVVTRSTTLADQARQEAGALRQLRRSWLSGRVVGFSATEVVRSWRAGTSTSRVLDLVQRPDGPRTVTVASGRGATGPATGGDPLTTLSARAVAALAAGYQLRLGGTDTVAGRAATVVVARRDGRDLGRLWLDDETGVLLRQDVVDRTGRLRRTAAFLTFRPGLPSIVVPSDQASEQPSDQSSDRASTRSAAVAAGLRRPAPTATVAQAWTEVAPADVARWQAAGWPCPQQLAEGFALLAVRRGSSAAGAPVLELVYGDGLSTISVFLQRGRLDEDGLKGLVRRPWGAGTALVRSGWPEVMVWQGGQMVITAIGDDDAARLQAVLGPLPRQPNRGTLGSLQHGMGSALAWFNN